jgi:hypothetical protein
VVDEVVEAIVGGGMVENWVKGAVVWVDGVADWKSLKSSSSALWVSRTF